MSAVLKSLRVGMDEVPATLRRSLLLLAVTIVLLLVLHHRTALGMAAIWARSDTFAHAFLVPPISLWLIWRGRHRFAGIEPRPDSRWLLPFVVAALAWWLGDMVSVNAASQFALVAMVVLLVPLSLGWPATRVMLFPLLYLFFCVPVGEFMLPTLMEWTADFTVAALRLSGVPVYREGLQFIIPSGSWSVVEGCSGVRYLMASVMVGSLFAYMNYQSLRRRLLFVGVSVLVPVLANWVRAYMIVMLGHLSDNRIATGVDHLVYGWVFFGVVIAIMFMIGARWAEPDAPRANGTVAGSGDGTGPIPRAQWVQSLMALACAGLLAAAADRAGEPSAVRIPDVAMAGAEWSRVAGTVPVVPRYKGASGLFEARYRRTDGQEVGVWMAYYRDQGPDRKLISSVNILTPSEDPEWAPIDQRVAEAAGVSWRQTELTDRRRGIGASQHTVTVWQTYWVDQGFEPADVKARLIGARGQVLGRGDDAAVIYLMTPRAPRDGGAAVLADFVARHLPAIRTSLQAARQAP